MTHYSSAAASEICTCFVLGVKTMKSMKKFTMELLLEELIVD